MTGTAGRHELKIWSTQTWSCLQTVTLLVPLTAGTLPSPTGTGSSGPATACDSYLQVGLDLSATYLVLCDITRKVVFHSVTLMLLWHPGCECEAF